MVCRQELQESSLKRGIALFTVSHCLEFSDNGWSSVAILDSEVTLRVKAMYYDSKAEIDGPGS